MPVSNLPGDRQNADPGGTEIYTNYVLMQQLYKTDEKTFEEYITASSAYYQAQEARMKAENDAMLAQYRLEEIIGLKWEQVQHPEKED
ncbi:MAG: hypothetical protein R2791_13975 [Saprospiraceae bacterium]